MANPGDASHKKGTEQVSQLLTLSTTPVVYLYMESIPLVGGAHAALAAWGAGGGDTVEGTTCLRAWLASRISQACTGEASV